MISVCMATYNGEKYVVKQLESILAQLECEDEVIVSDDGSSDNTVNVIRALNDKRIKVYINEGEHGFVRNFENALKKATGDYIFLSDQDDVWIDYKVDVCIKTLDNCDFVVSDCITIDETGKVLDASRFKTFKIKKGFWRLMFKTRYLGCCMAFKRKVLDLALPFPENTYYVEHDLWLAAVAEKYFRVSLIDEPLIYYVRRGSNVSDGGFGKGYPLDVKIKRRIYRLKKIFQLRWRAIEMSNQEGKIV